MISAWLGIYSAELQRRYTAKNRVVFDGTFDMVIVHDMEAIVTWDKHSRLRLMRLIASIDLGLPCDVTR